MFSKETTEAVERIVKEAPEKIGEGTVGTYKKIEDSVVGAYKKVEETVVGGFEKVTDKFVEKLFTKEGETVEEAKARMEEKVKKLEEASAAYRKDNQ